MTTSTSSLKPVSFLVNFWDILTAPSLALARASTVQPRSWWFPALLSLLAPLLHVGLTLDLQIEQVKKGVALSLSAMTPEQADAARPMLERMTHPNALLLSVATQVALALLVSWAISMLILYFGVALLGNAPSAGGLWAALAWTWTPFALRPLVQLAWNLYAGSLIKYPGLSSFFATGKTVEDQRNPLFIAASQIDLFALWHLILIYILLRVVGKLKNSSSLILVILYAIIQLGLHLLPALISKMAGVG